LVAPARQVQFKINPPIASVVNAPALLLPDRKPKL